MILTKLLIPEYPLQVLPTLACRIGLNEAMVAHRLHRLIHESGKWVMLSTEQWNNEFPFWSRSTVQRTFTSLEDQSIIISRKLTKNEIVTILSDKHEQLFRDGRFTYARCTWCNAETLTLNEHHYPIPKASGGEDIVNICPNCHCEFHSLELVTLYSLNQQLIDELDEVERQQEMNNES